MQSAALVAAPEEVRAFIQEYFDAWRGTDVQKILRYYSDDVVIQLPTGTLEGKSAVRDNFVVPFVSGFPGNVHSIRNLAHAKNLVAVEWSFDAVHGGSFANVAATGKRVQIPGCSFYEYDLESRKIPAGRIYFDLATLLRQIGAGT
ncbi:MAG TPA: nuclear transport factor 2 family protein [Terriglobales bacterium]|nr:nuclear transport factor 2 family protein [Terriglobales bacterium]